MKLEKQNYMKLVLNDGRVIKFEYYIGCSYAISNPQCAAGNPVLKGCGRNVQRQYSFALGMKYYTGIWIEVYYGGQRHSFCEYHPDFESAQKRVLELNEIYNTRSRYRML